MLPALKSVLPGANRHCSACLPAPPRGAGAAQVAWVVWVELTPRLSQTVLIIASASSATALTSGLRPDSPCSANR